MSQRGFSRRGGGGGRGRNPHRSSHHGGAGRGGGAGGGGFDGSRPPPHLKGKEIGLWHARRQKNKERDNLLEVELSSSSKHKILGLIQQLEASKSTTGGHSNEESEFIKRYKQNLFENAMANTSVKLEPVPDDLLSESGRIIVKDDALKLYLERKQQSQKYQSMLKFREKLPAYKCREEFLKLVSENQVVVVSGETGCGKTTQCCQLILDDLIRAGNGSLTKIVCTQPRRISAISVAERVADERDEKIGAKSVGYSIRLESRIPPTDEGTILFCTTGVIFQYLKDDPRLSRFSHIVVDEIHERDVLSDFLLLILKDLIVLRPDLKVVLMSATINADHFSKYFGNCPKFNIPGFTFPVKEYNLEDVLEKTKFVFESKSSTNNDYGRQSNFRGRGGHQNRGRGGHGNSWKRGYNPDDDSEYQHMLECHVRKLQRENLYPAYVINELGKPESEELNLDLIVSLLDYICTSDKDKGAVLIFVPGWDQISKLNTQLQSIARFSADKYLIIPLHSLMPTVNQREVFNRPSGGRRKIVIATNIAETSITIDDIVHVIDTGKIKMTNFDLRRNIESLDTEWVSLANAMQRRGRAGRVQEGICYHLYNQAREMTLDKFKKPEILRKRLDEVVLQIKILKLGGAWNFLKRLMDPPSQESVSLAIERLILINALDKDENLTPLGFHLAQLPMDPQTGKMILMGAIFGCLDPITTVASSLSFKDGFYIPLGQERQVDQVRKTLSRETNSDHMVTVFAMEGFLNACKTNRERDFCYRNFLSANTLRMLINMKGQFAQHLYDMKFLSSPDCNAKDHNINANNIGLIKAIICAGLYPNIAKIKNVKWKQDRFTGQDSSYVRLGTFEDGKVDLHPKSVNCGLKQRDIHSPFLAYYQKMKSTSVFLYDTTMVSAFPLIFFGATPTFKKEKKVTYAKVDNNVDLKISSETFDIVQALRKHLNNLLAEKISNPGPTCWNVLSREGAMLRAITELITAEHREAVGDLPYSDSDTDF